MLLTKPPSQSFLERVSMESFNIVPACSSFPAPHDKSLKSLKLIFKVEERNWNQLLPGRKELNLKTWYTLKSGEKSAFFILSISLILKCSPPTGDAVCTSQSCPCSKSSCAGNSLQKVPAGSPGQWSALCRPPWPYWDSWSVWVLWEQLREK